MDGPPKKKPSYTTKQLKAALKTVGVREGRVAAPPCHRVGLPPSSAPAPAPGPPRCAVQVTDETPTFAVGRTYKSLKSKDKKFLSFEMNEELTILSVEGTPNGLWIARAHNGKVRRVEEDGGARSCRRGWIEGRFGATAAAARHQCVARRTRGA